MHFCSMKVLSVYNFCAAMLWTSCKFMEEILLVIKSITSLTSIDWSG